MYERNGEVCKIASQLFGIPLIDNLKNENLQNKRRIKDLQVGSDDC